jgi:hypothetical protein
MGPNPSDADALPYNVDFRDTVLLPLSGFQ